LRTKEEIQERADEIAGEKYGKAFYELSEKQQDKVYEEAQESWTDHYASLADSMKER